MATYTDTELLEFFALNHYLRLKGTPEKGYTVWDCSNGLVVAGEDPTFREAIEAALRAAAKES